MDWRDLSESQPTFARIPLRLRTLAKTLPLAPGQTLCRLGDRVDSAFAVIRGEMRLVRRDRNGNEVILQRVRAAFFAEASLSARAYHCDLVAAESSEVLCFPVRAFREALNNDAAFRDAWMSHLANEVRKLRAQCERLSLNGAAQRVAHYIESEGVNGVITLSQTRKAWAAQLGLTHESLYRTLRRMQEQGVIQVTGARITMA